MNKLSVILMLCSVLALSKHLKAQIPENTDTLSYSGRLWTLGLNLGSSGFQNVKESTIQYYGITFGLEVGYHKFFKRSVLNTVLHGNFAPKTKGKSERSNTKEIHAVLNTSWMMRVKEFSNSWKLSVGPELSGRMLQRTNELLGNNSSYTYFDIPLSAAFSASGKVLRLPVRLDLGVGLVGYVAESNSFGYPRPQNYLEQGDVVYGADGSPSTLKYGQIEWIGDYVKLKCGIRYEFSDRWNFSYTWNFNSYTRVKNYPVAFATNLVQARWLFGKKGYKK